MSLHIFFVECDFNTIFLKQTCKYKLPQANIANSVIHASFLPSLIAAAHTPVSGRAMAPPERHVPAASPLHAVRVAVANLRGEARAAALAAAPAVRRASSLGQLNAELAAAAARLGQGRWFACWW